MTKVLWFSRHDMSDTQRAALENKLGDIVITKVNGTIANVFTPFEAVVDNASEATNIKSFQDLVQYFDVVAIVAPIGLQQQILSVAGDRPVIMTENKREFVEGEAVFTFVRWFRVVKVEVVTEDFAM